MRSFESDITATLSDKSKVYIYIHIEHSCEYGDTPQNLDYSLVFESKRVITKDDIEHIEERIQDEIKSMCRHAETSVFIDRQEYIDIEK